MAENPHGGERCALCRVTHRVHFAERLIRDAVDSANQQHTSYRRLGGPTSELGE